MCVQSCIYRICIASGLKVARRNITNMIVEPDIVCLNLIGPVLMHQKTPIIADGPKTFFFVVQKEQGQSTKL